MSAVADRRRSIRQLSDASEPVARLRLRAGRELAVVDIGASGALVETDGRLLPGTHVDVHVMTAAGRELVRSRVVRAFVSALSAERIVYRGALAFHRSVELIPSGAIVSRHHANAGSIPSANAESGNAFVETK